MKTTTKAWVIGGSIITAFFLIQFGLVFFAPLPEKPPVIIIDVKNDTVKPDPKPNPDDQRIIINDTGVFIFNFSENTTLK